MNKNINDIVLATTTLYKPDNKSDVVRSKLATESIKEATSIGYSIIVVDSGSSDELLREFENYGANIVTSYKEMGECKRLAIQEAYNLDKKVIAYLELEKKDYINEIIYTALPIISDKADIVIPHRNNLYSLPTAQRHTESFGNLYFKELTGRDLDMFFGCRTFHRDMAKYFLECQGQHWLSVFAPVMDMIYDNKRVMSVKVDYTHPVEQTNIEEHSMEFLNKRLFQLNAILPVIHTYHKLHLNLTSKFK